MSELVTTFFNLDVLREVWPLLVEGLWLTLASAAVAVPLSIAIGLAIAVAQDLRSTAAAHGARRLCRHAAGNPASGPTDLHLLRPAVPRT